MIVWGAAAVGAAGVGIYYLAKDRGKSNQLASGLVGKTEEELKEAYDTGDKAMRQRIQRHQKAMGTRNKQKRSK